MNTILLFLSQDRLDSDVVNILCQGIEFDNAGGEINE